jgi:hypothetical protein
LPSLNFIHVGFQKSSIRFCFIYLTHFISVMGFILQNFKFIHYSHISSVSSKPPYSPMSSILCEVSFHTDKILIHIVMKSFRFCPSGHFYPCLKFHLCRQFYPKTFIGYRSHTGVSSHIIQYAHSGNGNQALAVEHIVRSHHRISASFICFTLQENKY